MVMVLACFLDIFLCLCLTMILTLSLLLQFSSVQFSQSTASDCLWPRGLQHIRLPCPYPIPGVYSSSCPLSQWYHPTISSSVIPFSSLQSFPASGSFQMSQLFPSGGQSLGVSASTSVHQMNIQDWFPLGWTSWNSLKSKGLSRVLSNTIDRKHQFWHSAFMVQLSLPYMTTRKTIALSIRTFVVKVCLCFLICCLGFS